MLRKFIQSQIAKNISQKSFFNFHKSASYNFQLTVREALNSAMDEELARDEKVFLMGEEVGQYGGAYKISKGLYEKYGDRRVIDTPIAEIGFTGISIGSSYMGLRPIVEFMTFNFALQAIDQILNSCAKQLYMSAGEISCPIVFRGCNGAAAAVAAQHSQCFGAWYSSCPGLIVLSPYDSTDARGLLKAAIRNDNPVVFLESEIMYGISFDVKDKVLDKDFVLPIGKAKIMQEGKDVSIVSFSRGLHKSIEAAKILEGQGISCEIINLRSLRPLDRETIVNSVKKTNRLVTVEEGWPQCGIGAEICALIFESSAFDYLDAPVERVTGLDVPMPYAPNLEAMALPSVQNIVNAVQRVVKGKK